MSIIVDNIRVFNFEGAIRGMRNPLESWGKSDSLFGFENCENYDLSWEVIDAWTKTKTNAEYYSDEYEKIYLDFEDWILKQGILFEKNDFFEVAYVGPEDMKLMQKLIKAGNDESKFMRQIMVSMDIEAPLYW